MNEDLEVRRLIRTQNPYQNEFTCAQHRWSYSSTGGHECGGERQQCARCRAPVLQKRRALGATSRFPLQRVVNALQATSSPALTSTCLPPAPQQQSCSPCQHASAVDVVGPQAHILRIRHMGDVLQWRAAADFSSQTFRATRYRWPCVHSIHSRMQEQIGGIRLVQQKSLRQLS